MDTRHMVRELQHGSAGALASQEGHALNHRALRAEALLGGRGGEGAVSGEGVCIGGDHTEFYESFLPQHFWFLFPLIP